MSESNILTHYEVFQDKLYCNSKRGEIMHSSLAIANKLLDIAEDNGAALTPLALIKLVYFCHCWMLAIYSRPLLEDKVEAWRYGPALKQLYYRVKDYGDRPVPRLTNAFGQVITAKLSTEEADLIEEVYSRYGRLGAVTLSKLANEPGSPWDITWKEYGRNSSISNDLIEHHFKILNQQNSSGEAAAG